MEETIVSAPTIAWLAFAIGAVIVWLWTRLDRKSSDNYAIPLASGFIAGESLLAAGIAILGTLLALSL